MGNNVCLFLSLILIVVGCSRKQNGGEFARETLNSPPDGIEVTEENTRFIYQAIASSYAEVELAQLALEKTDHLQVQELARTLETDHSLALQDLQNMAQVRNAAIPDGPDEKALEKLSELQRKDGRDFNEAWCRQMINDHEKTIDEFQSRMEDTDDPDLKAWINEKLPTLKRHLESVKLCLAQIESGLSMAPEEQS